jgi:DHA2 family multidrug resistance protein-like MFS transporter
MPSLTTSRHRVEGTKLRGRYLALLVICAAELLVVLDNTVVNVALPSMGLSYAPTSAGCSGWSTPTR